MWSEMWTTATEDFPHQEDVTVPSVRRETDDIFYNSFTLNYLTRLLKKIPISKPGGMYIEKTADYGS
jgi:hypothetical protein